jgi:hypothetical protein
MFIGSPAGIVVAWLSIHDPFRPFDAKDLCKGLGHPMANAIDPNVMAQNICHGGDSASLNSTWPHQLERG